MPGLRQDQTDNWRELVFISDFKSDRAEDFIMIIREGQLLSFNLYLNNLHCKNCVNYLIKKNSSKKIGAI